MEKFRAILEKSKKVGEKELAKLVKQNGDVPVIILGQDIWVNIEQVEDGYAYGIDQFDDDREIDLSKETLELAEAKNPYSHKGGSDSYKDATKIEKLSKEFDFYSHMIDDAAKMKKAEAKNKEIKAELKKLGVTEITLDKETRKI